MSSNSKAQELFCNWCADLQHCMTGRCLCMDRGSACGKSWCPVSEDMSYAPNPSVPKFEKGNTCSTAESF